MKILVPAIQFIADNVPNFGWAVIIAVIMCYIITIPFKIMSIRNEAAKRACTPKLMEIRKKYNANAMGVSHEDSPDMPPEIRRMSHDERDEAMSNEIAATYRENNYHMWIGWIPGFLTLLAIVFLYNGIRAASPEGVYTLNWVSAKSASIADKEFVTRIIITMFIVAQLTNIFSLVRGIVRATKTKTSCKGTIISGLISVALSLGLSIWIARSVTTAIAIAITTLYLLSFGEKLVTILRQRNTSKKQLS